MKKLLAILLFCVPALGQAANSGRGLYSGSAMFGTSAGFSPTLPQVWVDNNELTCGITTSCYPGSPGNVLTPPAYEFALGSSSWISGVPPSYCSFSLPYAATGDGKQAAINDMEACRTTAIGHGAAVGIILDVPPGVYTLSSGLGILIPQTSSTLASAPLIVRSTYDSTLAGLPEPVCAGGIQDNLPTSGNIGLNNPDCTGRNMYYGLGPTSGTGVSSPCNVTGVICELTTLSTNTTTLSAISVGSNVLVPLANGYVSPGNAYVVDAGGAHPETISCTGSCLSTANQVGLAANTFLFSHAAGATVSFCASGCSYTLANGTNINTNNYNYLGYMYHDECSATGCIPLQMCSGVYSSANPCNTATAANNGNGPDHWEFMDGVAQLQPGDTNSSPLVFTGTPVTETSLSQFAAHIHFRRYAALGDWTSLATGYNSISSGFVINGCNYCSLVGSQTSQLLRPGAEGHAGDGDGITLKFANDWFEGQSSCIFPGGFSTTPGILGFVPYTDVQFGRVRCTFPYSWLGANGGVSGGSSGTLPNNNNYYGGAMPPWTTGNATMVYISANPAICSESITSCVVWISGDPLHDSNSSWAQGAIGARTININGVAKNYALAAASNWTQVCGTYCFPGNPPTVIPLDPSTPTCSSGCGTASSPVTFTMSLTSVVRKNIVELKSGMRDVYYGVIAENNDNSGAQNGTAATIDIRNTSGTVNGASLGQNYQSTLSDWTVQNTLFRNSCEGFEENARGLGVSGVTYEATRELLFNVFQYNISGSGPGCNNEAIGMILGNGHNSWNATCSENGEGNAAICTAFASIDGGVILASASTPVACPTGFSGTCTTYTTSGATAGSNATLCGPASSNPSNTGSYLFVTGFTTNTSNNSTTTGFQCAGSTSTTLILINASGVAEADTGSPTGACGSPASTPTCANPVLSNSSGFGLQVINIRTGEPVSIMSAAYNGATPLNCAGFSPQSTAVRVIGNHTVPIGIGPITSVGSAPWAGAWSLSNVQVTFPWTQAGAGTVDTTGQCVLSNIESGPSYVTVNHNDFISDAVEAIGQGPQPSNGPTFIYNHAFLNSIFFSNISTGKGLSNSALTSPTEGTNTQVFDYDANTVSMFKLAFPGRSSASGNYTEFGNNSSYPDAGLGPCTPPSCSISPPVTGGTIPGFYFPDNSCAGVGMTYPSCSVGAVPLTAPDYHYYELCTGTAGANYCGGSASSLHNASSDGSDIGTIIPLLDTAQTTTTYVCASVCGSPGPFPD